MNLTDWVAVYAALLSTFIFARDYFRSRPRFRVMLTPGVSDEGGDTEMGVFLSIQNTSPHTVHVNHVSILYPYGEPPTVLGRLRFLLRYKRLPSGLGWVHSSLSNEDIDDRCPASIDSWKSQEIFIPQAVIENYLASSSRREIRAEVQDPLWNSTYSHSLAIDWYDGRVNDSA